MNYYKAMKTLLQDTTYSQQKLIQNKVQLIVCTDLEQDCVKDIFTEASRDTVFEGLELGVEYSYIREFVCNSGCKKRFWSMNPICQQCLLEADMVPVEVPFRLKYVH